MRVNDRHLTAKSAKRVYLHQCCFFREKPKNIEGKSAREIYEIAETQFKAQSKAEQARYAKSFNAKEKVSLWLKIQAAFMRIVNKIKNAPRVGK